MLLKLHIKNFLLIQELEIDFLNGFTVVTGETGSGKSIIIDALLIVFGEKISSSVIRNGSDQALFEVEFGIKSDKVIEYLSDMGMLDLSDKNSLLCRRIIGENGKSRSFVNGNLATQKQMKYLGELLLDVHTQHATITLLKNEVQRNLLDSFAGITDKVLEIERLYRTVVELDKKIANAEIEKQQNQLEYSLLKIEYDDLSQLNVESNEWDNLMLEHKKLSNAQFILENLDFISNAVDGDYENSLKAVIKRLIVKAEEVHNVLPKCENILNALNSVLVEIEEANHDVNRLSNSIEVNHGRLSEVNDRISRIFDVARKHRVSPDSILQKIDDISVKLGKFDANANTEVLQEQKRELLKHYDSISAVVSQSRIEAGQILAEKVNFMIQQLGINGFFEVALIKHQKTTNYGKESVEYQVCFNKGLESQALAKVASGGELSRVALALYLLLSINSSPEVIIFDEIDVGIGGRIAAMVGKLLKELGMNKQVICITHQAQTASYGDNHLAVRKEMYDETTILRIDDLNGESRVREIARMLGGETITELTIKHAMELLNL